MPWRRKDGRWIAQVREGRQRIQKVFPGKSEAIAWEADRKRETADRWQTRSAYSLGGLANEYLEYSKIKHSEKTWKEKRDLFRRFFAEVGPDTSARLASVDDTRKYLQNQAVHRSGYAANKDRKNLLAWGSWINRYKAINTQLFGQTERFPEVRQGRYVPPEEDFWKVYEACQNAQDKVMLLTYLHTAARKSELFRLRWEDVDFGERKIRLYTRKRKDGSMESDWLPLTDALFSALVAHRDFVGGEWVFPNADGMAYKSRQHVMRKLCARAGVRRFDWHAIRHLTASILAQNDVPMIQIKDILRHRALSTTERYLKRLGDLKEALEVLGRKEKG
jgi:integrase